MIVAYYRVSTDKQGERGLGMEAQRVAVEAYATRAGEKIAGAYTEVESGRCRSRPVLAEAVAHARRIDATLVVAKLDRLARDVGFVLALVDTGAKLYFLDLPSVSTGDPIVGRLMLSVMASVDDAPSVLAQAVPRAKRRAKGRR